MAKAKDLTDYLMNKFGGEQAVLSEFYGEKMKEMITSGATLAEIISTSKKEKWYSVAATMSIADVMGIKPKKTAKKASARSARLSASDKEKMVNGIVKFLEKKPWSGKSDIAKAVKFDASKVGPQIVAMKKAGMIKSSGERAKQVHALKGTKVKAPTA